MTCVSRTGSACGRRSGDERAWLGCGCAWCVLGAVDDRAGRGRRWCQPAGLWELRDLITEASGLKVASNPACCDAQRLGIGAVFALDTLGGCHTRSPG